MDEYQIIERIKEWYKTEPIRTEDNFLVNNKIIISQPSYERFYEQNPSINKQVTGYVYAFPTNYLSLFQFPMLERDDIIPILYLYKIGYIQEGEWSDAYPLPNLKYYIVAVEGSDKLAIELVDLDVVANNLNLPKIVISVLGSKLLSTNVISDDKLDRIQTQLLRRKLFAGNTWNKAWEIVYNYFDEDRRGLAKKVVKIGIDYNRVFRPYRVVYNTKTWQPVLM